jgi:hypothetical protein
MLPMKAPFFSALVVSCLGLGCTASGVALRPDGGPGPEKCPEKALEAMRILRLRPGDTSTVVIDANQSSQSPIIVNDGPVESYLERELGYLEPLTRMYGQIWTGGPNVVIRYYEARPPDGDPIPICAVARLGHGQLKKKQGPAPGTAELEFPIAGVYIVDGFR